MPRKCRRNRHPRGALRGVWRPSLTTASARSPASIRCASPASSRNVASGASIAQRSRRFASESKATKGAWPNRFRHGRGLPQPKSDMLRGRWRATARATASSRAALTSASSTAARRCSIPRRSGSASSSMERRISSARSGCPAHRIERSAAHDVLRRLGSGRPQRPAHVHHPDPRGRDEEVLGVDVGVPPPRGAERSEESHDLRAPAPRVGLTVHPLHLDERLALVHAEHAQQRAGGRPARKIVQRGQVCPPIRLRPPIEDFATPRSVTRTTPSSPAPSASWARHPIAASQHLRAAAVLSLASNIPTQSTKPGSSRTSATRAGAATGRWRCSSCPRSRRRRCRERARGAHGAGVPPGRGPGAGRSRRRASPCARLCG
jgi:hypothetical protein